MSRKKTQKKRNITHAQQQRRQAKAAATAETDRPTDRRTVSAPTTQQDRFDFPTSDDVLLLTIPQVCTLLNLSRSTLDRMAKTDSISGRVKIGGQIRYHRPTVETWLLTL